MTRALHLLAMLIATVLAGQAFALHAPAVMLCKSTGKVMKSCPCPDKEHRELRLERQDCCELFQAESAPAAARLPTPAPAPTSDGFSAPPVTFYAALVEVFEAREGAVVREAPRPTTRLFVTLRQLLI